MWWIDVYLLPLNFRHRNVKTAEADNGFHDDIICTTWSWVAQTHQSDEVGADSDQNDRPRIKLLQMWDVAAWLGQ